MKTKEVSFDVTRDESSLIGQIVARAATMAVGNKIDCLSLNMDLTACHANGCPLDLERLYAADNFNFAHDVFGIAAHINRDTGELEDFFSPRFSARN